MQNASITKSMPVDKFLTMAVNLINKSLLEASRTEARRLYRELEQGKDVPITTLQMEDKTLVRVDLALDHERYQGELNFRTFRVGVSLLLSNAVEVLKSPEEIRTFRSEHNPNTMLFGVFALTAEDNKPSVLVLGSETGSGSPVIRLGLVYLDHLQFKDQIADNAGDIAGDSAGTGVAPEAAGNEASASAGTSADTDGTTQV